MIKHSRDARLLQHDLRDPDAEWITCPPPGKIALVSVIPAQQRRAEASACTSGALGILREGRHPQMNVILLCLELSSRFQQNGDGFRESCCGRGWHPANL